MTYGVMLTKPLYYDTISAGATIATTGYSGYCLSSHGGTGEHLHLELYYGETQKDPEIEMSN